MLGVRSFVSVDEKDFKTNFSILSGFPFVGRIPILILVKFFVPRDWIMESIPLCPADPLFSETFMLPKGISISSCTTMSVGFALAKDFTALPELFIKVWGFAKSTLVSFTMPSETREVCFLDKVNSGKLYLFCNSSIIKKPTLCLVFI